MSSFKKLHCAVFICFSINVQVSILSLSISLLKYVILSMPIVFIQQYVIFSIYCIVSEIHKILKYNNFAIICEINIKVNISLHYFTIFYLFIPYVASVNIYLKMWFIIHEVSLNTQYKYVIVIKVITIKYNKRI